MGCLSGFCVSFELDGAAGDAGLAFGFDFDIVGAGLGQGVEVYVEFDADEFVWLPHCGRVDGEHVAGAFQGPTPNLPIAGLDQGEERGRFAYFFEFSHPQPQMDPATGRVIDIVARCDDRRGDFAGDEFDAGE